MAIVQTNFIQKYPEYRKEIEDIMRFANMSQNEAEIKVARRNNLKHSSNRKAHGRWVKMLKLAGAVTSTTAGLEPRPLYGKKKKKKEEDEE
tara:strand:+ start:6210 stop:6482 length:273 start_codon:yes stop_codon:yes gene_type:complete